MTFSLQENLVINKLTTEHSPLQTLLKNKKFNKVDNFNYITKPYSVCVIGFGDLGVELLLSSFENSRFINEDMKVNSFNALVIDENMDELKEDFLTDTQRNSKHTQCRSNPRNKHIKRDV